MRVFTVVVVYSFIAAAFGGWVMNIIKLIDLLNGPVTGWLVGRVVGVFAAPVGAVLGYL